MPTELVRTSPLEYPTATAEPGRSVCGANVPSGPGGTASTGCPAFAAACVSAVESDVLSPLTEIGVFSGFAWAIAHFIRAETFAAPAPREPARALLLPRAASEVVAPARALWPPRAVPSALVVPPALAAPARADALPVVAARRGTSTGVPMIASIDVASATFPPYSFTDCEIAPMLRATPAPSVQ